MRRILIVDDEPMVTQACQEAFRDHYEVRIAHDGETALRLIQELRPDLIVLDWRLRSEIEGRDVLLFVKREYPAIPVFVVTGSVQFVKEIKRLGAQDCLLKPCGDLLRAKVKSTLPPDP